MMMMTFSYPAARLLTEINNEYLGLVYSKNNNKHHLLMPVTSGISWHESINCILFAVQCWSADMLSHAQPFHKSLIKAEKREGGLKILLSPATVKTMMKCGAHKTSICTAVPFWGTVYKAMSLCRSICHECDHLEI